VRAVWSFWSKPFREHHRRVWLTEQHHLFAWVLSVETARQHYQDCSLFTDEEGARLLVDGLRLPFTHVSTALNALAHAHSDWWALGKLMTYGAQREPFVHIDSDVFLWKRLPQALEQAPVFAQNPETFPFDAGSWYRPTQLDDALRAADGWAPPEWHWSVASRRNNAACCGIFGGSDLGFVTYYADLAVRMIEHPRNQIVWANRADNICDNILVEQYLLLACLDFHRQHPGSAYAGVEIGYLFASSDEAFDDEAAALAGYTHLIGGAKSNVELARRLEARVQRDYPAYYERCLELAPSESLEPPTVTTAA
jgi:hypothetical protein